MPTESYEVLAEELTLHRDVRELTHALTGERTGYQLGQGKTHLEGDVISAEEVGTVYKEILADKDNPLHESLSKKLKKVSDQPSQNMEARLGLPFSGYEEMDAEDIAKAMSVLPSTTIQRIKEYEAANEGRTEIVDYNIGFGEHPDARMKAEQDIPDQNEDKDVRDLTTTEVVEGEGLVRGEGVTGTGMPAVAHGFKKKQEGKTTARKGRRTRATPSKPTEEDNN